MNAFFLKKTLVVHSGTFHADDVCAAATILLAFSDRVKIVRTRDPKVIEKADIVADVGGDYDPKKHRFDHHQSGGAGQRANGVPYAAFGLVWKKFGAGVCGSQEIADQIDEAFVQWVDGPDNAFTTVKSTFTTNAKPFEFFDALFSLNPTWQESDVDPDVRFAQAVQIAKTVLMRLIARAKATKSATELVKDAYTNASDKRLIILDAGYPWTKTILQFPEPLYVVFPSTEGWHVRAVPKVEGGFENRKNFPEAWGGKNDTDFEKVSGVIGAKFAHRGLFLVGATSKTAAIALARKALEN